jgi:hypothetical protein
MGKKIWDVLNQIDKYLLIVLIGGVALQALGVINFTPFENVLNWFR